MNVKIIIRNKYGSLSKTYKKIADYMMSNGEELLKLTSIEIAQQCETSSASVVRFVKSIGFSGLDEFKISVAKTLKKDTVDRIDPIISKMDDISTLCDKLHILMNGSIDYLFYLLDKNALKKSFDTIRNADNIYLLGIGASFLPAYDLFHKLMRANLKAHFYFDTHMTVEVFNYITKKDTVIAFSYSGSSKEIVYPSEIASSKNAKVIAVTRNKPSKLSKLVDILLAVPDNEELTRIGAIASKYSSMAISDILYLGVIQKRFDSIEKELVNTNILTRKLKLKDNGN